MVYQSIPIQADGSLLSPLSTPVPSSSPSTLLSATAARPLSIFVVDERYRIIRKIGSGSSGIVCSAYDRQSSEYYAIKKISNALGRRELLLRALREIRCLQHFRDHPRIIQLIDVDLVDTDLYLTFQCMDTTLHEIIYSNQALDIVHIQWFMYQLFSGLKYIHSADVIHRDLKPANILVNKNCHVKIADFGLARNSPVNQKSPNYFTEYICTRWYRAPEVMIKAGQYDKSIDLWSLGCVFGEILGRKVLFPGKDYIDQIYMILLHCGLPASVDNSEDQSWQATSSASTLASSHYLSPSVREYLRDIYYRRQELQLEDNQGKWSPTDFGSLFPDCPREGVQLLQSLLQWHPHQRISALQGLRHPFLLCFSDPHEESLACDTSRYSSKENEIEENVDVAQLQLSLTECMHNFKTQNQSRMTAATEN